MFKHWQRFTSRICTIGKLSFTSIWLVELEFKSLLSIIVARLVYGTLSGLSLPPLSFSVELSVQQGEEEIGITSQNRGLCPKRAFFRTSLSENGFSSKKAGFIQLVSFLRWLPFGKFTCNQKTRGYAKVYFFPDPSPHKKQLHRKNPSLRTKSTFFRILT